MHVWQLRLMLDVKADFCQADNNHKIHNMKYRYYSIVYRILLYGIYYGNLKCETCFFLGINQQIFSLQPEILLNR